MTDDELKKAMEFDPTTKAMLADLERRQNATRDNIAEFDKALCKFKRKYNLYPDWLIIGLPWLMVVGMLISIGALVIGFTSKIWELMQ